MRDIFDKWLAAGCPGDHPSNNAIDFGKQSRAAEFRTRLIIVSVIEPVLANNYLLKGWLDRNCLLVLYGLSNAGKTFMALNLATHIAGRKLWRVIRINGEPVLYIPAEGGASIRNRLATIKRDRPELADAPFYLLPLGLDLHGQGDVMAVCEIMP